MSDGALQTELEHWLHDSLASAPSTPLGHGYQATVRHYESPFGPLVVKSPHRSIIAGFFGRLAIAREYRIYKQMAGIAGVPALHALLDDTHLVIESVQGPSLREHERQLVDREQFFAQLLATLEAMHAAGIAHGDLKRKENILVGPGEQPYLIDFGIACRNGERGFRRWRFEWTRQLDYNAWIKLKYGRVPTDLSPEDAARYKPLWIERIARWIRVPWQKITMRRQRQRFWRWWRRDDQ